MSAGRPPTVPEATRQEILRQWGTESGAALARRLRLPVSTVRSIASRAGQPHKRPGRPRKEAV